MKNRLIGICCVCLGLMTSLSFAVERPTGQGFGSVEVITNEGGINLSGTTGDQEDVNLLDAAGGIFNRVLGIMGLIALLIVVWGGFSMLSAGGNEERYNNGWTTLKNAAIGLAIIALSWFIVSLFFWITNLLTTDADEAEAPRSLGVIVRKIS